ncbi:MAG: TadE family protein [Actinobacteria bacterium]|jgi:Flp pilus assembly protein TadG|nr:MAG: pilus assembly protein [Microbacterium sp.]RUA27074.1 MAG: TadE family protein [Actinomycetota bacterium]HCU79361.1 TadE family protein [Microbacterium sp.]
MVAALLTALTLGVIQLGIVTYVRNVVHDAAVEGAYYGALADTSTGSAVDRTREVITRAIGAEYGSDVGTREIMIDGQPVVEVTVRTGIPLVGLWPSGLQTEVTAHAPLESFDR